MAGESWCLQGEEAEEQRRINERYEAETVMTDWIDRHFTFSPEYDEPYSMADVISAMELDGFRLSGSERSQAMELARVLVQKKARKEHTRDGKRWFGLMKKPR